MNENLPLSLACPITAPKDKEKRVLMGHGSGGAMTAQLLEAIFLPAFGMQSEELHDGAFLSCGSAQLAFTTDAHVVQPLFFPGGNIGDLAVNGTINDLAMCGAKPKWLSCSFILEEGFAFEELKIIVNSMKKAADAVGARLVAGDTKVVEKGCGDGLYISTSGIGLVEKSAFAPSKIEPGDQILVSGDLGRHGTAIMSVREGLEFESAIESDTRELWSLVEALVMKGIPIHCMRDLTRGGLATVLVELAEAKNIAFTIDERAVPIHDTVRGACEFLGLDPLYVACEGRAVAFVPAAYASAALEIMRSFDGKAGIIGETAAAGSPRVSAITSIGTKRLLQKLSGGQLPRIC